MTDTPLGGTPMKTTVQLGAMVDLDSAKFDALVPVGTLVTYLGIHPTVNGWHHVGANVDGRPMFVPCQLHQVTPL